MAVLRRMSCSSNDCRVYFPCAFITDLYTGAPALIVHTQEKKELPSFSFFPLENNFIFVVSVNICCKNNHHYFLQNLLIPVLYCRY